MRWGVLVLAFAMASACGDDDVADGPDTDAATTDLSTALPGAVGGSCDEGCQPGLECVRGYPDLREWPGGYCTRECAVDADCPFGSRCSSLLFDASGSEQLYCMKSCERNDTDRGGCRSPFRCVFDGVCGVGCEVDTDCSYQDWAGAPVREFPGATCQPETGWCAVGTNDAAAEGDACLTNTDCNAAQRCLYGYCYTLGCDRGGEYACPDGFTCKSEPVGFDTFAHYCVQSCELGVDGSDGANPDDRCPDSFGCWPAESDPTGLADSAYCTFLSGFGENPDATVGDPCTTVADCAPGGMTLCSAGICTSLWCDAPSLPAALGCGPTGSCATTIPDPDTTGREQANLAEYGFCLRDCSEDAGVCAEGSVCNGTQCAF